MGGLTFLSQTFSVCRRKFGSIRIETPSEWPAEQMVDIWNKAFPCHRTTLERFNRMVLTGSYTRSGQVFLAWHHQNLLGWIFVDCGPKQGNIHIFASDPAQKKNRQAQLALFDEAFVWFKKRGVKDIYLNSHPVFFTVASKYGFGPFGDSVELKVTTSEYRSSARSMQIPGLDLRFWRREDHEAVVNFFKKHRRDWTDRAIYDPERVFSDGTSGMFVAALEGRIVGFCRFVTDSELRGCSEIRWVWAASTPENPRGYLSRLIVEEGLRGHGIGTALAAKALNALFDKDCGEIEVVARNDELTRRFYSDFGFRQKGRFLKLKWKSPGSGC